MLNRWINRFARKLAFSGPMCRIHLTWTARNATKNWYRMCVCWMEVKLKTIIIHASVFHWETLWINYIFCSVNVWFVYFDEIPAHSHNCLVAIVNGVRNNLLRFSTIIILLICCFQHYIIWVRWNKCVASVQTTV